MTKQLASAFGLTILLSTMPATAEELPPSIRMSAACAPVGSAVPSKAPIVLALESNRLLYYAGERVTISAGTRHGLESGQRFFVRRPLGVIDQPRGEQTAGWIRIAEAHETSAIAVVEFSCDAIAIGDHLEPFGDQALPRYIDRTNATGSPDFSNATRVLYGNDGRQLVGDRDFVLANAGQENGVTPGMRYAVYHSLMANREPNVSFGEAVVVSVFHDKSLLRITEAKDAVRSGDTLVLRQGGVDFSEEADAQNAPPLVPGAGEGGGEGSAPLLRSTQTGPEVVHQVSFDDVAFDFDKYTLKPDTFALLDQAVQVLQQNPTLRIKIEGYSCNIGTVKYNLALGKRRATAVRSYLIRHGVDAKRLTMVSYGESQPKYDNASKETRRLNRRAALVVNIER
jgi:outer membrane protein OmpA-like peptidoglycan-associated protein